MKKKLLSLVLAVALIFSITPAFMLAEAHAATAHSQAEAVAWANARANEGWCVDVDGYYGCQCVDLILAYYDYLGVSRSRGNACDYASNSLPAGWTRVYSNPQPGDIIVWGAGAALQSGGYNADTTYGHIGIVTGIVSNTQVSTVETNTYNHRAAKAFAWRYSSTAACFIRPDFTATAVQESWEGPTATQITQTNAYLSGKVNFSQTVNTTQCGVRVYNSNGTCVASKDESVNYNYSYVNMWYDITSELGVTLTAGRSYSFQFYTISNGKEYWSSKVSFTTTGHTHSYSSKVTKPTCTAQGYTTHTCSCGNSYKDTYTSALGHSYGAWKQTKAPTCTATGTETRTCSRCSASETREVAALDHNYANGVCTRCGAADPDYIAAPELKITTSAGKPKITWNAVNGATKYWIYRSTDGVNFKYYDSTTSTSYTNKSTSIGTTYYYKVKAVGIDGATSDFSVSKSTRCNPAAPTVSISRVNGKAKLTWKAVSGADKYWVYRSTDGKNFSVYTTVTGTSYTNSGAASGTKYYYYVRAVAVVNGVNISSAKSSTKSLITTLAKPTVKITTSNGKPKITWSKVTGADKYYIYRSTDGKNFSYYDTTTSTSYTNTGAKKNTKYYYKVKAVCASNSYANSAQSSAVSIKATK